MYCNNCGNILSPDDKACSVCKAPIIKWSAPGYPESVPEPESSGKEHSIDFPVKGSPKPEEDKPKEGTPEKLENQSEKAEKPEDAQPDAPPSSAPKQPDSAFVLPDEMINDIGDTADDDSGTGILIGDAMYGGQPEKGINTPDGYVPFPSLPGVVPETPAAEGEIKNVNTKKKKDKKGGKKKGLFIAVPIVSVFIIAAGAAAAVFVPKYLKYNDAKSAMNEGDFETAIKLYSELGDFKDSADMADHGVYYTLAQAYEEAGEYSNAAALYLASGDYEDSNEKGYACYYKAGEAYLNAQEYDSAIEAFTNAGEYSDAKSMVSECTYQKAKKLMSEGKYREAAKLFSSDQTYSDSASLMNECNYKLAGSLFDEGKYDEAKSLYEQSGLDDYQTRMLECDYQTALSYYSNKDYASAIDLLPQIYSGEQGLGVSVVSDDEYNKIYDDCCINLAKAASDSKDYITAIDYYNKVTLTDVSKKINEAKLGYIKEHKDYYDGYTMLFLCELKLAGDKSSKSSAKKLYKEISKVSFKVEVNPVSETSDDPDAHGWTIASTLSCAQDEVYYFSYTYASSLDYSQATPPKEFGGGYFENGDTFMSGTETAILVDEETGKKSTPAMEDPLYFFLVDSSSGCVVNIVKVN